MKNSVLALCFVFILTGCSTFKEHEPLQAVNRVDLDQFMGEWYVIAAIPTIMDANASNATETFSRAQRGININYEFINRDGEQKTISSRAMVDNPGINTDWHITFPWLVNRERKIVYLEPDYSVAVIGSPERNFVRILARQKSISSPLYSDIILHLQNLGYDVGDIRRISQR